MSRRQVPCPKAKPKKAKLKEPIKSGPAYHKMVHWHFGGTVQSGRIDEQLACMSRWIGAEDPDILSITGIPPALDDRKRVMEALCDMGPFEVYSEPMYKHANGDWYTADTNTGHTALLWRIDRYSALSTGEVRIRFPDADSALDTPQLVIVYVRFKCGLVITSSSCVEDARGIYTREQLLVRLFLSLATVLKDAEKSISGVHTGISPVNRAGHLTEWTGTLEQIGVKNMMDATPFTVALKEDDGEIERAVHDCILVTGLPYGHTSVAGGSEASSIQIAEAMVSGTVYGCCSVA